jgi:hypothetical protein
VSPTLSLKHRLRVLENRVLRRIVGPKRDEVTGEWKKLHMENFKFLNLPPDKRQIKSKRMGCSRIAARMGKERSTKAGKKEATLHNDA